MATFINTNAAGRLTYEIQPEEVQTLFSNLKELSNADIENIFAGIDGENVSDDITLSPGTNCESVTLVKAVKHSNALYMQFTAVPSTRISTAGSVGFSLSGAAPDVGVDWRIILGAAGTAHYHGYVTAVTENGCTIMLKKDGSVWELEESVNFSAIIPLS